MPNLENPQERPATTADVYNGTFKANASGLAQTSAIVYQTSEEKIEASRSSALEIDLQQLEARVKEIEEAKARELAPIQTLIQYVQSRLRIGEKRKRGNIESEKRKRADFEG